MSALLTSSRLKTARACQRLHLFEYILGYRPVNDAEAVRLGSLIHKLLEAWWLNITSGTQAALDAVARALLAANADPFDAAKASAMMMGYHLRWADEPYEVLGVEVPFECDLRNPTTGRPSQTWRLAGKLDAIVRDRRDGRVLVVEHKTSSEPIGPGSEYWRRLRMDGQVSVYFEGARSLGYDIAGCLYDVLGKPGQRPLKATPEESRKYKKTGELYAGQRDKDETADEYSIRIAEAISEEPSAFYQRGEVVRLEGEMTEALFDIWQLGQQIRESELAQRFPRNPDACSRFNRTCPFLSVCCGEASLEDTTQFRKVESVHPELEGETQCQPQQ